MSWGFYRLPLETSTQGYTSFSTPFGSFNWLVMPMGLTGSLLVFQYLMEKVLVGLTWTNTILYLDDCNMFSRTAEENIQRLRDVYQRFKDANLKINPLHCEFFRQHVLFFGHIDSGDAIQADPAKTSAVHVYPVPTSVTEAKSFLELRNVSDFAAVARALHQLTLTSFKKVDERRKRKKFQPLFQFSFQRSFWFCFCLCNKCISMYFN